MENEKFTDEMLRRTAAEFCEVTRVNDPDARPGYVTLTLEVRHPLISALSVYRGHRKHGLPRGVSLRLALLALKTTRMLRK